MANEIAVTEKSIGAFLQSVAPNLSNYAARDYNQGAWLKTAMLCILESDDLRECMATESGKRSLYYALRYAATTGLSLNPQEGKACLVPRKGKIMCWVEMKGWVELLLDTGRVDRVHGFVVYTGDGFSIEQSLDGDKYTYRPNLDDRGAIRGFCSAIRMKDGTASVHWMTLTQMEAHRDKYGMGTDKPDSAWNKSFEGRGIAACVKLHIRRLALAPADAPALAAAVAEEGEDPRTVGPMDWHEIPGVTAAELEKTLAARKAEERKAEKGTPPAPATVTAPEPVIAAAKAEGKPEPAKANGDATKANAAGDATAKGQLF